jgi:hypothetical protein
MCCLGAGYPGFPVALGHHRFCGTCDGLNRPPGLQQKAAPVVDCAELLKRAAPRASGCTELNRQQPRRAVIAMRTGRSATPLTRRSLEPRRVEIVKWQGCRGSSEIAIAARKDAWRLP